MATRVVATATVRAMKNRKLAPARAALVLVMIDLRLCRENLLCTFSDSGRGKPRQANPKRTKQLRN
jgi:hypothetical protein